MASRSKKSTNVYQGGKYVIPKNMPKWMPEAIEYVSCMEKEDYRFLKEVIQTHWPDFVDTGKPRGTKKANTKKEKKTKDEDDDESVDNKNSKQKNVLSKESVTMLDSTYKSLTHYMKENGITDDKIKNGVDMIYNCSIDIIKQINADALEDINETEEHEKNTKESEEMQSNSP